MTMEDKKELLVPPKIVTGTFSITDHKEGKIWIMKETGENAGEGSEFSKGFFDQFLSDFFDKYM